MTMIVGLNLSDRLYLAADTRVTHADGTTQDNVLKLLPLLDRVVYPTNNIALAVAGNVKLATFFERKIYSALRDRKLSPDIRELYATIKDFLDTALLEWVDSGNALDKSCCLLFAGTYDGRNKKVDEKKLSELIREYETKTEKQKQKRPELEKLVETNPVWKLLDEKMRKEAGMSVTQKLAVSDRPRIPPHLESVIATQSEELKGFPDSLIFSVKIFVRTKEISFEKAEWGELLAYGSRISKDSVPPEILATLEFAHGREKSVPHLLENAVITTTILDVAKEQKIASIGGTVILNILDKNGLMIAGKDLIFKEKDTRVNINRQQIPLIPFNQYRQKDASQADAELSFRA